ncbi:GTA baseplate fiber-binding domain-containing protein [Qipengyuania flava]|uniref:GTA baseplate fiber-binding domain-containing protein n=1 Tax=Qipengyuania flava TaxID=192812 RepID=UPI001C639C7A|nr:phage tail protein [Qipengyuania flava]QYJ07160.1 phage tail protein [Qipengyuania flava]
MATLVLGALGTLVGGPIGGAIGATLGRSVDAMVLGSPRREGPRLKDLAVSTSSYGQPIPALYGSVRAPGTVIWSTDLKERSETNGGGKGKPKTTTYSYSVSLAIALSSRPIDGVGRIWADGNLLRGQAGDLKTGGTLRIYAGHSDQQPDPLMAADLGAQCPAYRGCAYAVFEDLALEDFGNRIPALSFEIMAGSARDLVGKVALRSGLDVAETGFPELGGFVHEGGSEASLLTLVDRLRPIGTVVRDGRLAVEGFAAGDREFPTLAQPAAWEDGDFGTDAGNAISRRADAEDAPSALRYYDTARDYQPGLQRTEGKASGRSRSVLEFPGAFAASEARGLLAGAARRAALEGETLYWRMSELDPDIGPGRIVRAPGLAGLWRIASWEWRERGVELELVRHAPQATSSLPADPGSSWNPPDRAGAASSLRVFELPWDGTGSSSDPQRFAAVGAATGRWSGAALYEASGAGMVPLASVDSRRASNGSLLDPLPPSSAARFEPRASLRVQFEDTDTALEPRTIDELASGANKLLVGDEIVQFAGAAPEGAGVWHLTGLLRGRGGTEDVAHTGHATATQVTVLDDRLFAIPGSSSATSFAAIGASDGEPASADLESAGRTRRPLTPAHPRCVVGADGGLTLSWVRRARGGWAWLDEVDQPLVEQVERYEVGIGSLSSPSAIWETQVPEFTLDASEAAALPAGRFWVRQCGDFAKSPPLDLGASPTL